MAEFLKGDESMEELLRVAAEVGGANLTRGIIEDADHTELQRLEQARRAAINGGALVGTLGYVDYPGSPRVYIEEK